VKYISQDTSANFQVVIHWPILRQIFDIKGVRNLNPYIVISRPGTTSHRLPRHESTPRSCTLFVETNLLHRGADKSLARPTSRCIVFDGENISFDASLFIHINSTNIPPIMIINSILEHQNLLSL
jgi:hypothetical protein